MAADGAGAWPGSAWQSAAPCLPHTLPKRTQRRCSAPSQPQPTFQAFSMVLM